MNIFGGVLMLSRKRLDELRQRIHSLERGERREVKTGIPFGCSALDEYLPGGGVELGALHEVGAAVGICHETAATLFVAGILARMEGMVLWCSKARDLFAPGLAGVGLHPERIIFAETGDDQTLLAAMEEGLRHGGLAAVVGEVGRLSMIASRRLHLAARETGTTAFALFRQSAGQKSLEPSASVSRWRVTALPSSALPSGGIGRSVWRVELLRCRDAAAASWVLEGCDEKGCLGLVADVAYGSAQDNQFRACA